MDTGVPTFADQGGDTWPSVAPVDTLDATSTSLLRFKLGAMLGRGGMGEVVSARDDVIGRAVAVKKLRTDKPTPQARERFLREAKIQGRLEHPAVLPVHELQTDEHGNPFFVMKRAIGVTLSDVLKKLALGDAEITKRWTRRRLLAAYSDVCLALEFAHSKGVVHRDLKPANIILGDYGEVYVIDWGIAHVMATAIELADVRQAEEHLMQDGVILGSPGYMSPEQIKVDQTLDGRSDVYALGCILFEMLTLQPLRESGIAGIALALLPSAKDMRPSSRAPERDIPPELDVITQIATRPDRTERYASARLLHDAVQHYLDGDRDVALRKELAAGQLADARAAFARGTGVESRREALQSASRALALDPTSKAPAELVGRLMLEPPTEMPREVTEALERADDDALYAARRLIVMAAIAYLAFIPILYVIGFSSPLFLGGCGIVASAMWLSAATATRAAVTRIAYTGLIGNSLMTLLFSITATPFFIAPSLGVITAMSIATHPRVAKVPLLIAVVSISVLAPLVLELAGVLPRSMTVADGTVTLHTGASGLDYTTTTIALVLYVVALLAMAVILAKALTSDRRLAQRAAQLQSWQLRQLMP